MASAGHPGLPQADDLPTPFLLRRRRQLAHGHVLHAPAGMLGARRCKFTSAGSIRW